MLGARETIFWGILSILTDLPKSSTMAPGDVGAMGTQAAKPRIIVKISRKLPRKITSLFLIPSIFNLF
jgi:hypothetical protein